MPKVNNTARSTKVLTNADYFRLAIPQPSEPIFELAAAYERDTNPQKVNVSIGAYRDEDGKPWVLPTVRKARIEMLNDPMFGHEYSPIAGLTSFVDAAVKLAFGTNDPSLVGGVQTISGTGALRIGAEYLLKIAPNATVYLPKPTWVNHWDIFSDVGLTVKEYRYYAEGSCGLDIEGMIEDIKSAPIGSIILLHACAHNPTGVDPTLDQWERVLQTVTDKRHFCFFDMAYQGFASGNPEKDAFAVRRAISLKMPVFVAQSFAKNFGLYGERVGALSFSGDNIANLKSHLCAIVRCHFSCGPAYGARIVSRILNDPKMLQGWYDNITVMANRIGSMRSKLFDHLQRLQTPGNWSHIKTQIGMFSFTGLSPSICEKLVKDYAIYLPKNGRISIAGLNDGNIAYFAESIDKLVRAELLPPTKRQKILLNSNGQKVASYVERN